MKYSDNMTDAQAAQLLAELDAEWPADADNGDPAPPVEACSDECPGCPDCLEQPDPVRDGWVGSDGRP